MSKQSFPAELRILQSVDTLSTGDNSLKGINTTTVSDRAIVLVEQNNSLYVLRKESTDAEDSPDIIDPSAGPGRWHIYGAGEQLAANVNVAFSAIPPQSSVVASFVFPGLVSGDVVVANLVTSLASGVIDGSPQSTGADAGSIRFLNATGATVAGATVAYRMVALPGPA